MIDIIFIDANNAVLTFQKQADKHKDDIGNPKKIETVVILNGLRQD